MRLLILSLLFTPLAIAQPLSGRVTSAEEGAMEGVLVSAQRTGSPITITVVTGADGIFSFPAAKLAPGHYALRIRAVGYELDGAAAADVPAKKTLDLKLRKATDLAAQLTNTEWFMSMPGTAEQKRPLIECMSCHTFERIVRSKLNADEFMPVLKRMQNYANNTTMAKVQPRKVERDFPEERARKLAEYLATVNLSQQATWPYELKTLPRPRRCCIGPCGARRLHRTTCVSMRKARSGTRTSSRTISDGSTPRPASTANTLTPRSSQAFRKAHSHSSRTPTAIGGWA